MRCLPIRSVFRAALLAGLIGSSQYATVSASWKDCMPPRIGSCFIHDLQWERFQQQPIDAVSVRNSALQVDEASSEVLDVELRTCLAAAKRFELKQQVEAIQTAIESNVTGNPNLSKPFTSLFVRSQKMFYTFFENQNFKLAKSAVSSETLPVVAVVPQDEPAYDCDWNCGDWCQGYSRPLTVSLPSRDGANLFVYTFETSETTSNGSSCHDTVTAQTENSQIVDSCAVAYSEYVGDNLLTEAEISQWNSAVAAEFSNPWQMGVDPVCPEVQSTEIANVASSSFGKHSVCCPVGNAEEAVAVFADVAAPVTGIDVAGVDVAGVDVTGIDVTGIDVTGIDVTGIDVAGIDVASVDVASVDVAGVDVASVDVASVDVANVDVANVDSTNNAMEELAARPPILEAESEINDSNPVMEFQGQRPVHCLISDFDAGAYRWEGESDMFGSYDYSYPWLSSLNAPSWRTSYGKRFAFGDNSPRMPIAPSPVAAFSKEDLQFANRFSSDLLGQTTEQVSDVQANDVDLNSGATETFLSKDFLTTLQTSAYGSIILPVNQTQRMAMDYAMKLLAEPASTSRIHASRKVAKELRSVGQFLVDFAIQIENRVEQVEIARGENKQHESNHR